MAESVLALGGSVEIGPRDGPESRPIKAATDLPRDYFQVRRVLLAGVAKPLGDLPGLLSWLRFPKFDRLESIDLSGITGLDYGFPVPIHGLRELSLFRRVATVTESDATITGLPSGSTVRVRVVAVNDAGDGPPSDVVEVVMPVPVEP